MAMGLKCGGTLEERAQRLFSTKDQNQIDQSLYAKKTVIGTNVSASAKTVSREQYRQKEIAGIESQIYCLSDLLKEQRTATKENVQRKQARGDGERNDSDQDQSDSESDEDEEDNDDVP